ncbi:hypothetical protein MPL1_12578 [Methylophaga lonarensis MPL]|uniref:DUF3144 domain-containing protein n=2 Tax=Methylophaga lonarensis TaxID=999151 RepID=M7NXV1_9GAMM|nr:hypothetical protein MPL1_12578 [Methylophaga lonarensis MPL]
MLYLTVYGGVYSDLFFAAAHRPAIFRVSNPMSEVPKEFFDRADEFIKIANQHMQQGVEAGQVSAAFMYGLARYSAWFTASGWTNGQDMAKARDETVEFFVNEYRRMLELNMDDYIQNFDTYVEASQQLGAASKGA